MKFMEIFNRDLNTSLNQENKDVDAFRLQVDLILKSLVERLNDNKIAIVIGAGKMKDFSATFFVRRFDEVVLTDVDMNTVIEAESKLNLSEKDKKKITKIRIEYTGFEKNAFFQDFKERIINCRTFEKIDQVISSKLQGLEDYRFLRDYEGCGDLVYVSPIYTQLVYNQILRECSVLRENGYPEHMLKYIENTMLDKMVQIIDTFNDNIITTLKDDGYLIVLSDVFQLDKKSNFYLRVKNGIRSHEVMEEMYEGYKKKYGMGIGDYGLLNLDEKLKSYLSRWLIWPYDEDSSFVVKLKIYKKRLKE
ncbi:MAG: hypothetical protein KQ78_00407 [Candidatus Izimaplasma bacterium HR2]|nr:MAG: hypothetical protein KQ78_00407 [Candidatus Izimaplasma bacterium HR2]